MSALRRWALPLVPIYGAALAFQEALRVTGLARARRLGWPVVSIGSLSAGGAGKTPATIALARLLHERGWTVDVLSRGYGRPPEFRGRVAQVDPGVPEAARRFGDEPVLIAQRTGLPVWVGANRRAVGLAAEAAADPQTWGEPDPDLPPRVHLLDDGFQHRQLAREFDLLVLTAEDLVDSLLPAGNLREPLSALRRAHALAVREDELEVVSRALRRIRAPELPLWTLRRVLRFPAPLGIFSAGLRPLAFCGLARPGGFAGMLAASGCGVVDTLAFPDHHRYQPADAEEIARVAKKLEATGLLCTEKDAVKLTPGMRLMLEEQVGPLVTVELETSFVYEAPVVRALEDRLGVSRSAASRKGTPAL